MDASIGSAEGAAERLKAPTRTRFGENFPVASRLVPAALRPHVHVFYLCVRAADDVADDPGRPADEKTALLSAMDAALQGNLNLAMLNHGGHAGSVHAGSRFIMSAAHTDAEIERTLEGITNALREVREQGLI